MPPPPLLLVDPLMYAVVVFNVMVMPELLLLKIVIASPSAKVLLGTVIEPPEVT